MIPNILSYRKPMFGSSTRRDAGISSQLATAFENNMRMNLWEEQVKSKADFP